MTDFFLTAVGPSSRTEEIQFAASVPETDRSQTGSAHFRLNLVRGFANRASERFLQFRAADAPASSYASGTAVRQWWFVRPCSCSVSVWYTLVVIKMRGIGGGGGGIALAEVPNETVVGWIRQFNAGDSVAAVELWQQYFDRVASAARRKLGDAPRRMSDEEDVASSVLRCLCNGAAEGRFGDVANHDDLWRLLMTITRQKCVDQIRRDSRQKRGGGQTRGESVLATSDDSGPSSFDDFLGAEPTPEYLNQLDEQLIRLMKSLPDQVSREIVECRLEGWSNEEIAQQHGISIHAVRRKLRLVRTIWQEKVE